MKWGVDGSTVDWETGGMEVHGAEDIKGIQENHKKD